MIKRKKPIVLCILDGWGVNEKQEHNAIAKAKTPFFDHIMENYPNALIDTSGDAVGLPDGQMGNSEVGHVTIGSGRIIMQTLPKIDKAIKSGELKNKEPLKRLISELKKTGKSCHILGMISYGGVHSHQAHMEYIINLISKAGIEVIVHGFLDGRDVPPKSAEQCLENFYANLQNKDLVKIATLSGRYYAMDRDRRWDRIEKTYNAIISGEGEKYKDSSDILKKNYAKNITDEFIKPSVINGYEGVKEGDAFIMANFRSDRVRQILSALIFEDFSGFNRRAFVKFGRKLGLAEYASEIDSQMEILFTSPELKDILGEVVAKNNLRQLRIAETEKYAHVTFFLNGGIEDKYDGEERILINSPDVATYDLQPEMSAYLITEDLVRVINEERFDFIVVNYANTDMVGHTGNERATIKAVEVVDECLAKLGKAVLDKNGAILITADHGNAEKMCDDNNLPHTSHTLFVVPVILVDNDKRNAKLLNGKLCDIAPTVLELLHIKKPDSMTGQSLIKE